MQGTDLRCGPQRLPQTCGVQGIGDVTDGGLRESGAARPRLQPSEPGLDTVASLSGQSKAILDNQLEFHHAPAANLLTRSVSPAHAPATVARA